MSNRIKLGMKIFFKIETSQLVKETNVISDTYNINILAAEIDRRRIVVRVR